MSSVNKGFFVHSDHSVLLGTSNFLLNKSSFVVGHHRENSSAASFGLRVPCRQWRQGWLSTKLGDLALVRAVLIPSHPAQRYDARDGGPQTTHPS